MALPAAAPAPPESLLRPCDQPAALPAGVLDGAQVARLWGRDRMSLSVCGARHGALAAFARSVSDPRPEGPAGD